MAHSVRIVFFDQADPNRETIYIATERDDDPDDWKLPGGKIKPDETRDQAVLREAGEETVPQDGAHFVLASALGGLVVPEGAIVLYYVGTLPNRHDPGSERHIYTSVTGQTAFIGSEEISASRWSTVADLPRKADGHPVDNAVHIDEAKDFARDSVLENAL